jgi:hypothetical protein
MLDNLEWYGRLHEGERRKAVKGEIYSQEPWYGTYRGMMDRCENPNSANYHLYGGRGIKVCDEWHDIKVFKKWVESSGYSQGLSIDRIDVDGNYEPSNCRFANRMTQANNTSKNHIVELNGHRMTIAEFARVMNINKNHAWYYIDKFEREVVNG